MSSARESQGHHGLKRAASPDVNGRGARGSHAAGGGEEEEAGREAAAGPRYGARVPRRDVGIGRGLPGRPLPRANGRPGGNGRRRRHGGGCGGG